MTMQWRDAALALSLGLVLAGVDQAAPRAGDARPRPVIHNKVAVFAALDKITGDITTLRVPIDGVEKFGTFRITPRTCHTRPPTEQPRTMAFVEVMEHTYDGKTRGVFTGWMNAESPGLHAVEHPLFDVWLTGCEEPLEKRRRNRTVLRIDDATRAAPPAPDAPDAPDAPRMERPDDGGGVQDGGADGVRDGMTAADGADAAAGAAVILKKRPVDGGTARAGKGDLRSDPLAAPAPARPDAQSRQAQEPAEAEMLQPEPRPDAAGEEEGLPNIINLQ